MQNEKALNRMEFKPLKRFISIHAKPTKFVTFLVCHCQEECGIAKVIKFRQQLYF